MLSRFLIGALLAPGLVGCGGDDGSQESVQPDKPPNIVLITIDTLRADHLGCYGYSRDTSPNMDELARQSMRFRHAFVQWPKTSPSFASMLTSTYCFENGVRSTQVEVESQYTLLAEYLERAGYATIGVVSNPNLAPAFGFNQGFDVYLTAWEDEPTEAIESVGPPSPAQRITRLALQAIKDSSTSSAPLFVWAHYIDPHGPYTPPGDFHEMFVGDASFDGTETLEKLAPEEAPSRSLGVLNRTVAVPEEWRVDYYRAQYDAEIAATDEQVQALLDGLRRRQILEDAILILTSDHGESLGEHNYYFEHGLLPYDACMRVPLLVSYPGLAEPGVVEQVVGLLGLVPTILDLAGLPVPETLSGTSWRTLMEGGGEAAPPFVFSEAGYLTDPQRVIRGGRWKLVHFPDPRDRRFTHRREYELYDTLNDPHEEHDLFDERPFDAKILKNRLEEWMREARKRTRPPASSRPVEAGLSELLQQLGYHLDDER